MTHLHEQLTQALLAEMASGYYKEGDRFLSTRKICKQWRVSDSTACKSLLWLQNHNLLEAKSCSGYFLKGGFRKTALYHVFKRQVHSLPSPSTWRTKRYGIVNVDRERPMRIACVFSGKSHVEVTERIPSYFDESEVNCAQGFFTEAIRLRCNVQFYVHNEKPDGFGCIVEQLIKDSPDGIAVFKRGHFTNIAPLVEPLLAAHFPVVTVFDDCGQNEVLSVSVNNVELGYDAAMRFLRAGHKRIGVLLQPNPPSYFSDRADGCRRAIENVGRTDCTLREIFLSPFKPPSEKTLSIFKDPETRPTALLATRIDLLLKCIPGLQRLSFFIPRDVSVIAIAGRESMDAAFDTLSIDFREMGKLAMTSLRQLIEGEIHERGILVKTRYIRRGSIKVLRKREP